MNEKGYVRLPYVLKNTSTSINNETVWYANKWRNFLLKIKFFFNPPKSLGRLNRYKKISVNPSFYGEIRIKQNHMKIENFLTEEFKTNPFLLVSTLNELLKHKLQAGFDMYGSGEYLSMEVKDTEKSRNILKACISEIDLLKDHNVISMNPLYDAHRDIFSTDEEIWWDHKEEYFDFKPTLTNEYD